MLKRVNRITKRKDFEEVKKKGRIYHSPIFGVLVLKAGDKVKEFGMVISKKISKKAVERNKVKRLLAEAIRRNLDEINEGYRMIFLVKPSILGKKGEEIEKEVTKLLKLLK